MAKEYDRRTESLRRASVEAEFLPLPDGRSWQKEVEGDVKEFRMLDWRNIAELDEVVELQDKVWKMGDRNLVPENILAIIEEVGGEVVTAKSSRGELEGFTLCLPTNDPERQFLHMVGVQEGSSSRGLGRELMVITGVVAKEKGVKRVDWTYDPIMGGNARLYLSKLGAVPYKYTINKYGIVENKGAGTESRYKNVETDRFTVRWEIGDERLWRAVLANKAYNMVIDNELEWDGSGETPDLFRVSLPYDFTHLSTDEMMDWRRHLRGICLATMDYDNIDDRRVVEGQFEVVGFGVDTVGGVNCYNFKRK